MEKKTRVAVLMLSKVFTKEHRNAGKPTYFLEKMQAGTKLHTIRLNYDLWKRKADQINAGDMVLSVRQWEAQPYKSQQVEVARLTQLHVQRFEAVYGATDTIPRVWVDGCEVVDVEQVAKNDGLELGDWVEFFFNRTNHVEGVILQFTDFMY